MIAAVLSAQTTAKGPDRELARAVFAELIAIDTTDSSGSVTRAAEAMAARLRDAGVPAGQIAVIGPNERAKNLLARLPGSGRKRPVLFIGHLDVVAAPRLDWDTDPFELVEKDGYFYGRGTLDMKSGDAILVANLIQLWREGFKGDRDIIVALTAGEESFKDNGIKWLTENHRERVDAEFVINADGGWVLTEHGKPVNFTVNAAEKLYADFRLTVINPGGPSALPVPDNAIYRLAKGLGRLEQYRFPFELNAITREYFTRMADSADPSRAPDLQGMLRSNPDQQAIERVTQDALDNALVRTICVATRLEAGHGNNALPQLASANINCRILPGHSAAEVQRTLVDVLDDPQIKVQYVREFDGQVFDVAPDAVAMPASAPRPDVFRPLQRIAGEMWPGIPIIASMSVGESDAVWTMAAGMPTYALSALAVERDDVRAHGKNERVGVDSFYRGVEFFYRYMKAISAGR